MNRGTPFWKEAKHTGNSCRHGRATVLRESWRPCPCVPAASRWRAACPDDAGIYRETLTPRITPGKNICLRPACAWCKASFPTHTHPVTKRRECCVSAEGSGTAGHSPRGSVHRAAALHLTPIPVPFQVLELQEEMPLECHGEKRVGSSPRLPGVRVFC